MPKLIITVRCADCKMRVNEERAIEVHCTPDGSSTFLCKSCHENPDWRENDPRLP